MPDISHHASTAHEPATDLSRRDFVAFSVAGGLAATAGSAQAALPVVETEVTIRTPDGLCDAVFIHPASGHHPGVLIWPDAFGLRPAFRTMGRRLAAEGYAVLVPNPFYRIGKAPMYESGADVDFTKPEAMQKLGPLMASVNAADAAEKDAVAYVAFLDAQPQVDRAKKIGTQGYCMGGALVFRSAATVPDRIGAGGSFHGGGLVTDKPSSPHLLVPKMHARMYVALAQNDDQRQPDAKDKLKETFAAARLPAQVEVYPAQHGWCVPDMPKEAGAPLYNAPEAERAWAKLLEFYKTTLV